MGTNLPSIYLHVLHESPPILQGLLGHAQTNNKGQGGNHADSREGCNGCEGEDSSKEEIEIGDTSELFKDGFREEGYDVVLGGGNVIGWIIERFLTMEVGSIAVHHAGEARTLKAIEWIGEIDCLRVRSGTIESVKLAPSELLLPKLLPNLHGPRHPSEISMPSLLHQRNRGTDKSYVIIGERRRPYQEKRQA